ncbi:MAG TPA: PepSY domain-containing protein [Sphingomicrobium sp.]|nr:PepSY domain-containing protein [Sphingomicrobium sp.]
MTVRGLLLTIHRWIGLTIGAALLLLAVTGGILVMRGHFERPLNSHLYSASACSHRLSLDKLAAIASASRRGESPDAIEVDLRQRNSIRVQFANKDYVFMEPCSGAILGTENQYGGFAGTLDYLHRFRFMDNGREFAGWLNAICLLAIIVLGVVVWWPRSRAGWRHGLKYDRQLPGIARTLSLHRVFGIYVSALLLLMSITAVPISFGWAKSAIAAVTHSPTDSPNAPRIERHSGSVSMEKAWQSVRTAVPDLVWAALRYPDRPTRAMTVETLERDAPHQEANSYVFIDPGTGRAVKVVRYASGVSLGRKVYLTFLALHSGLVGGILYQLVLMLACFAVPVQAYSGVVPYLRRKLGQRPARLKLRLVARHDESSNVTAFEFVDASGDHLPAFSAGSHIDLYLPGGITRQYSLCNDPRETHRYMIAVLLEANSRGGCVYLHHQLDVGDILEASYPRNHFPLAHGARHSVLIAGGIGITPLLCMAERLSNIGASFELRYCVRSIEDAAFHARISGSAFADRVTFHGSEQGTRLDVHHLLTSQPDQTHIYVCGPARLIQAVNEAATAVGLEDSLVHREYFEAAASKDALNEPFDVVIGSTGMKVRVSEDESIVAALARAGIDIPTSCSEGICGTCITRVIEGEIEHRDLIMSREEQARHDRLTPCCSRASGSLLVLDV